MRMEAVTWARWTLSALAVFAVVAFFGWMASDARAAVEGMTLDGLSFSAPQVIAFLSIMASIVGSWVDLRNRSLSNAGKIDELEKEMNDRVDRVELKVAAVDAEVNIQRARFDNYRVDAARDFVTFDQFNVIKRELIEEVRSLRDLLEKRRD